MKQFVVFDQEFGLAPAPIYVEESAFEGVKRIANCVAKDVAMVGGTKPAVEILKEKTTGSFRLKRGIYAATVGKSDLLTRLSAEEKIKLSHLEGKREVYQILLLDEGLLIAGSDKRGTIYGLFALSEAMGVSSLVYLGDADPVKKERFIFDSTMEKISKEPSVTYRGFFINDEWPCFGNWTFSHFGGFTAKMYEKIFVSLLRMKGNYLWPAMWSSSFALDGPGQLNEELADIYGVVIGYSHHEPCLRASEEWDQVRGEDSIYGNAWNYAKNPDGLAKYWEDALIRSGKFENIITIGMRGERDSAMLEEHSPLADNINLLKEIILKQRELIAKKVNADLTKVPQLLAIYKEVEAYFYGDEETPGLVSWEELNDVILMFCEDNFGHMRALPQKEWPAHAGGYGMYYHLDYHGAPVSYEWMPSTQLSLLWEQMTTAYEFGVQKAWIVNVGDLKGNEIALQYFLDLAYDYEKWGISNRLSYQNWLEKWAQKTFAAESYTVQMEVASIYHDYVRLNSLRRPEALHADIYHPCHYNEAHRILEEAEHIRQRCFVLGKNINEAHKDAFYSLVLYPALSSMNLLKMQLYATINHHYASQGRPVANLYAFWIEECIREDHYLADEFCAFRDGKWKGMELERHIGFVQWNDDGWRYPVKMMVEPVDAPRLSVSRADEKRLYTKTYGEPMCILVDDFLYDGAEEVRLELSNDGDSVVTFHVKEEKGNPLPAWLSVSPHNGRTRDLSHVTLTCHRAFLPEKEEDVKLFISDSETTVAVLVKGKKTEHSATVHHAIKGVIAMDATEFVSAKSAKGAAFEVLSDFGKTGSAIKCFPVTATFGPQDEKPEVTYAFCLEEEGDYVAEFCFAPGNALLYGKAVRMMIGFDAKERKPLEILSESYRGGDWTDEDWCDSVLNQIRKRQVVEHLCAGEHTLTIGALEPGVVLEQILVYPAGRPPKASYLGPRKICTRFRKI